ncbi:MAG: protein kinase [Gemmatales bacterium]
MIDHICHEHPEMRERLEQLLAVEALIAGQDDHSPVSSNDSKSTILPTAGSSVEPVQIGPYRLLQKLGEGGMGTVWVAEQTHPVKRRVALKLIKAGMDSERILVRFEAERQALAMMDHPNIAKILDAGQTSDGRPYFAMELVKGAPVTKYCDEVHAGIDDRLKLFAEICGSPTCSHQRDHSPRSEAFQHPGYDARWQTYS